MRAQIHTLNSSCSRSQNTHEDSNHLLKIYLLCPTPFYRRVFISVPLSEVEVTCPVCCFR